MVAVSARIVAVRAGAGDIAVGEEHTGLLIKVLFAFFYDEFSFVVHHFEKIRSRLMVDRIRSTVVDIEGNAEIGKTLFDDGVVFIDGLLRGDGCFDAFFRYTSINRRYFLKELNVKLCDSKSKQPVDASVFDGVLLHLESYASFSRLTGHSSPEPLDPTAGYGGWYLP